MTRTLLLTRALDFAFPIVLLVLVVGFAVASPGFLGVSNVAGILHSMAPIATISAGMAMVVMMGKLDISVGSIALVSVGIAAVMMQAEVPIALSLLVIVPVGVFLGAVNGFIVCVLRVNPLIATLGTMIGFRGLGNQITDAQVVLLPDALRGFGNFSIGPIFLDSIIALAVLVAVDVVHRRTRFGRTVTAIGNDEATANRIGLPVRRTVFLGFVMAGALASIGGFLAAGQVGAVTSFLGRGLEFTAVAVVVVGGISLFGGRGSILWGVVLGALTFEVIRSGLNHIGANPYFYQLISGLVIFVAMYAAALKPGKAGT
ncbi:MAG: ABC transporter permease [Hyphomicrobiales bacterium]|nr:ABC transporter permease [Hyphomicrobiales bacterium]